MQGLVAWGDQCANESERRQRTWSMYADWPSSSTPCLRPAGVSRSQRCSHESHGLDERWLQSGSPVSALTAGSFGSQTPGTCRNLCVRTCRSRRGTSGATPLASRDPRSSARSLCRARARFLCARVPFAVGYGTRTRRRARRPSRRSCNSSCVCLESREAVRNYVTTARPGRNPKTNDGRARALLYAQSNPVA